MTDILLWTSIAAAGVYQCVALAACVSHLLRRDPEDSGIPAGVSVLKPVRGADPGIIRAFHTHVVQDHPTYEVLFGAARLDDPAAAAAQTVASEHPRARVIESTSVRPNGKAAVLCDLANHAKYPLYVVNDSDISVGPQYLRDVTAPLADPRVGLVTCLYRAGGASLPAQFEALGISTDFAPSVLVAQQLGVKAFGLGSTLAFRAETLAAIGGFDSIAEYLADDYQLGKRISQAGYRVHISKVTVQTNLGGGTWGDIWDHQVRWARTIRTSHGSGYLGIPIANATLWSLVAAAGGLPAAAILLMVLRISTAFIGGIGILGCRITARLWWLIPARDLFGLAVWAAGVRGSEVRWRDQLLQIDNSGRIVRITQA